MAIYKDETGQEDVMVPIEIFQDPELGLKEIGLLATLYSLPEDYNFSIKRIRSILCNGKSSIETALWNLEAKGYVVFYRHRQENGKFGRQDMILRIPDKVSKA